MAKYKIFYVNNKKKHKKKLDASTEIFYNPNRKSITVTWRGKKVLTISAFIGDVFKITLNQNAEPLVEKLYLPKNKSEIIMWILGFSNFSIANSISEYKVHLKAQRKIHHWWGYKEKTIGTKDDPYRLTICNISNAKGFYRLSGYVKDNIKTKKIIELFNKFPAGTKYPKDFVEKILIDRLDFSKNDLKYIKSSFYKN